MKSKSIIVTIVTLLSLTSFIACKKSKQEKEGDEEDVQFDKSAMFSNYADNLILPNLQSAKVSVDSLSSAFTAFSGNTTVAALNVVRQQFITAYIRYQHIASYEFGPSESELIRSNFNTYPADTVQINANISSGSYNLSTIDNIDAKGFPAIDFLLYGKNRTDSTIVNLFANSARKNYVQACISEMQNKLNNVINGWSSYRSSFVSSTGTGIGSSLGLLVNQLDFEVDLLKNGKLGIPLGKKSLGVALPDKCEAYYTNTISVRLAKECLQNIENDYLGRSYAGADGSGMDDCLVALNAQHNSGTLNDAIKNQFAVAKSKLALVTEPLSDAVVNNVATVDAAYIEIQKLLVLLKTDMPSAMGIVITYQDSDGD